MRVTPRRAHVALFAVVAAVAVGGAARADSPGAKLGEAFEKASPPEKLGLISIARTEKTLTYQESSQAVDDVAVAETNKGKTSEERLKLLGALRTAAIEKLKATNEERKAQKKQYVSFVEPESGLQQAIALAYFVDTAGPTPTVEALAPLKLIRDCTEWSATSKFVLAFIQEALARDKDYAAADHAGKLDFVKARLVDRGLFSDLERTYVENAIIADWLNVQVKAGKTSTEILAALKAFDGAKKLCFFTRSWAETMVKRLDRKG